jgi:hypothetical protein
LKFDVVFPIVLTPMFRTSGLNSKMQIIFNYPHWQHYSLQETMLIFL